MCISSSSTLLVLVAAERALSSARLCQRDWISRRMLTGPLKTYGLYRTIMVALLESVVLDLEELGVH